MSSLDAAPFPGDPVESSIHSNTRVVGTAGHVDHGKSTLIAALTGIHPDRLKEEQDRKMTIDLGFGWLTLPGGREIGIVDVPGHRDFIENMLAGIGGIDAVWLVVAADEGVMPQTREHLAIIDLLGVRGGLLVLTKTDLVGDPDWLEAVETDLRATVRGTSLEGAPLVRVSARTGSGLPELVQATAQLLDLLAPRPNGLRPRLALDRAFSMEGFGTVVTGTLTDGELAVGDEIEFLPSGLRGRVRGLQTHHHNVERAAPGSRTAVNVAGVPVDALQRGEVLVQPGQYTPSRRVDARIRLLRDTSSPLTHNRTAKLFVGTTQSMCRIRLLGIDELQPGEEGWIQLELQVPVVCARGDAFVLRSPSPPETIGGGTILDPHPSARHRRHDPSLLASLRALSAGSPADIVYETALSLGPVTADHLARHSGLPADVAASALSQLLATAKVVVLEAQRVHGETEAWVLASRDIERIDARMQTSLSNFHASFPLRRGMPREELRNQMRMDARPFMAVLTHLEKAGHLTSRDGSVALVGHEVSLSETQQAAVDALMERFAANPYAPPSIKECAESVGMEVWLVLRDMGILVPVSEDVAFSRSVYDSMVQRLQAELERRGKITLADVRDLFGTSRRYAQSFLEHLDEIGLTRRIGDSRVLTSRSVGHAP
ncbi:MAG TPA: selenocysteine-specific translation elongation factor [Anaerolineales bacterium]|nr:selenocysteine-specific translation elongation factor [Anaerolineales bacterium]